MKKSVDIEDIRAAQEVIRQFNKLDLREIELCEDGQPIPISPECLEEWKFIGLSNGCFIELEFWKEPVSTEM